MKKVLSVLLCASLALGISACGKKEEQPTEEPKTEQTQDNGAYLGTLKPVSETKVIPQGKGQVLECSFEIGDYVNAGDLLYKLDDNGLSDTIQTEKNSMAKAQISLNTASQNVNDLRVYAPASGILKNFNIKTGERVNASKIADIADESKIIALVPFNEAQKSQIRVGDSASVSSAEYMSSVSGKVTKIYDAKADSIGGSSLYNIEITVAQSGGLAEGKSVSATVTNGSGTFTSPVSGTLKAADTVSVVSKGSGNAKNVYVSDGQRVTKGQLLVEMENNSVTSALSRAKLDYNDRQIKLRSLEKDYNDLFVYAPASGTITAKSKKVLDNITSNSESVMTISDTSSLLLEVNVTEKEAKSLAEGKIVTVTLQGDSAGTVDAVITKVNKTGAVNGSAKVYPVTLTVDNADGLIDAGTAASVEF